ncbi:MAG: signal recognition particle-docking protein FtsY [Peptococcaceae bacterium]|jgi:fused signal recognition particle receptor|nr:signal recognition particle-docking protein FtsY [Peptococcaceae bacterium]
MSLFGNLFRKISQAIGGGQIGDEFYDELEEQLILSDVGAPAALALTEALRREVKASRLTTVEQAAECFQAQVTALLAQGEHELRLAAAGLTVILFLGVNGVGKTTTIGKLAHGLKGQGKKVLVAAADTFRAAAIDQLAVWCGRAGVDLIRHHEGADPGAVVYDGIGAARSRKMDVLLIDTAGRLQNKSNLMEELKKLRRIIEREYPGQPGEVLLVLDATTGQNALSQAKLFKEAAGVTGAVLTKLDGTAKGGVILGVQSEYSLPVKFTGWGEGIDDLRPFDAAGFSRRLFAPDES